MGSRRYLSGTHPREVPFPTLRAFELVLFPESRWKMDAAGFSRLQRGLFGRIWARIGRSGMARHDEARHGIPRHFR